MYAPPVPENEDDRIRALQALNLMDTEPEERFNRICRLAAEVLGTPVAYVSLIDRHRQFYKASCGLGGMTETTREDSMCAYTIAQDEVVVVTNAIEDERFCHNCFVSGPPHVRFYLGHPLLSSDGLPVGTFCVLDFAPREAVTEEELNKLRDLAAMAEVELNMRDMVLMQQQLLEQREKLRARNRFIRTVLGRYLTDEVADAILADPEGWKLGGELREVTVLMSDLRGFTDLSRKMSPTVVVSTLNRYLGRMVDIITSYGGTIDEIIGDAILVIFGAPVPVEDGPERAVACALAMQLAMEEVNAEGQDLGQPRLEMGIGINTGEVVVGNIGSERRMKYSVVGSPVNLAARIESFTVGGQILTSESTLEDLGDIVRVDGRLRVKLKGFEDGFTIFDVGGLGGRHQLFLPEPRGQEIVPERRKALRHG